MIKEHALSEIVTKINKETILQGFGAMVTDYNTMKEFYSNLKDLSIGDLDGDDFLDICTDINFESCSICQAFSKLHISMSEAINSYFCETSDKFSQLEERISEIAKSYCEPDDKELESLLSLTYDVIAGFVFMFWSDYGCCETMRSVTSKEEPVFDEIVYNYFAKFTIAQDKRHEKCIAFAEDVEENAKLFKIKLAIFDDIPEKEEEFRAIVGPDIGRIDPAKLTITIVNRVCDGDMSVDDLLDECSRTLKDGDEGSDGDDYEDVVIPAPGSATPKKMNI